MSESTVKKVYWKRGYRGKMDPRKAFNELERIKAKNGGILTAGLVITEARNPRNPLHTEIFKLDVEEAAEHHYLREAAKLMGSVEVIYEETPHIPPTRFYVTVTEEPKNDQPERRVYKSTTEALEDPVMRDEVLGNAIREAIAFRRKYAALSELAEVFVAIDHAIVEGGLIKGSVR